MSRCQYRTCIIVRRHPTLIVRGALVLLLLVHAALLFR